MRHLSKLQFTSVNVRIAYSIFSTASSGLNAMSAIVLEDIFKRKYPDMKDKTATRISQAVGNYICSNVNEYRIRRKCNNHFVQGFLFSYNLIW